MVGSDHHLKANQGQTPHVKTGHDTWLAWENSAKIQFCDLCASGHICDGSLSPLGLRPLLTHLADPHPVDLLPQLQVVSNPPPAEDMGMQGQDEQIVCKAMGEWLGGLKPQVLLEGGSDPKRIWVAGCTANDIAVVAESPDIVLLLLINSMSLAKFPSS